MLNWQLENASAQFRRLTAAFASISSTRIGVRDA
jgi:hypothetical protein